MPRYASPFLFTVLAAIGLPLLCGFVGESLVLAAVTNPANLQVPDLVPREKWVMVAMCVLMLWLGVHTKFFLRRYESSCQIILQASPVTREKTTVPLDLFTGSSNLSEPGAKVIVSVQRIGKTKSILDVWQGDVYCRVASVVKSGRRLGRGKARGCAVRCRC